MALSVAHSFVNVSIANLKTTCELGIGRRFYYKIVHKSWNRIRYEGVARVQVLPPTYQILYRIEDLRCFNASLHGSISRCTVKFSCVDARCYDFVRHRIGQRINRKT